MRNLDPALILRSPLILGAPIAGLIGGAAIWLLVGGANGPTKALEGLSGRGGPATRAALADDESSAALGVLVARPVFVETAAAPPRIRVVGVSRTPGRQAALVALGADEPAWMQAGETVQGLTLVSVNGDGAVFDSIGGPITAPLGETIEGASAAAGTQPADGGPPPGARLPPEPAAAPRP